MADEVSIGRLLRRWQDDPETAKSKLHSGGRFRESD